MSVTLQDLQAGVKNAAKSEVDMSTHRNILIVGEPGSGKSTQIRTLPGRKFVYAFDPNAVEAYEKDPLVDYLEFLPDRLPLNIKSLSKDKGDKRSVGSGHGMITYKKWEEHAENSQALGFFDDYDVIVLDSGTTLLDLIMDRILEINGRPGQWPQQDDYGPQITAFTAIMRTFTALQKMLYVTGHIELKEDKTSNKLLYQLLMTGRLRVKIPLLFSHVLRAEAVADPNGGKVSYVIQTQSDRNMPGIRTSMKGANYKENVDLDFTTDLVGQGLGGLLNKYAPA